MICFSGKHDAEGMPGSSLIFALRCAELEKLGSHSVDLIEGLEKLEDATEGSPWPRCARCAWINLHQEPSAFRVRRRPGLVT
jgi:hypothetical protein